MPDNVNRLTASLTGRYRIERELGAGGMATVYLAHDAKHNRKVAVKVLRPELAALVGPERFLKEIEITANLQHPNILPLFDSGRADEIVYYVMPFVEGESLRARLDREAQLPVDEAVQIARDVADALDYAHRRDVVHRDIKPENILLSDGKPMVSDFGIALAVSTAGDARLTETGFAVGTPAYMSPEQVSGEKHVDGRADLYALACMLYEMLAGTPPFSGSTARAIMAQHVLESPQPISLKRPVADTVARSLAKALAKEPDERFATLADFAQQLSTTVNLNPENRGTKSIAVLPFTNLSSNSADEYFSDGMTEDVIARLASVRGLRVIARRSVMQFKGTATAVSDIARALRVDAIVEGSVRRAGDRVRIVAQLFDPQTERQLWTDRYDRELVDVFTVQSEVAERIVDALQTAVSAAERAQLDDTGGTEDMEAYDLLLRARFHLHKWSATEWQQAIAYLARAIERDPSYAAAHASMAICYVERAFISLSPPRELFVTAEEHARRALSLDGEDVGALVALGVVHAWYRWNWGAAERFFQRAIELRPGGARARSVYGVLLDTMGDYAASMRERRAAFDLEPLDATAILNVGYGHLHHGRPEEAELWFRRALDREPNSAPAVWGLGMTLIELGRCDESIETFERAIESGDASSTLQGLLGFSYGIQGLTDEASRVLDRMLDEARTGYVSPYHVAMVHHGLGRTDDVFVWLDKALEERSAWMVWLFVHPTFKRLVGDPRLRRLMERMSLRPEWVSPAFKNERNRPTPAKARLGAANVTASDPAAATPTRIAVLPFANRSADPDSEYLSDGITEEIINALVNVPGLQVIARTSAFAFKGQERNIREIGDLLGVTSILEGSVRTAGRRLRITTQLSDVEGGHHLWSERYERELDDVFEIQDDIAGAVVRKLSAQFATAARPSKTIHSENPDAYDAYLRGRFAWNKGTGESWIQSIEYFDRAIEIDPTYALAWAGKSISYFWLGFFEIMAPGDAFPPAALAATQALACDERLAEAHAALASVKMVHEWDWAAADDGFQRALKLNPRSTVALQACAVFNGNVGDVDKAIEYTETELTVDPLWVKGNQDLGFVYYVAGRLEEAHEQLVKTLELDPYFFATHLCLGFVYMELHRYSEAVTAMRTAVECSSGALISRAFLGYALGLAGDTEEARSILDELEREAGERYVSPVLLAWVHVGLGDFDATFTALDQAVAERSSMLISLPNIRYWDPVRHDPRFQRVLKQMKLPYARRVGSTD